MAPENGNLPHALEIPEAYHLAEFVLVKGGHLWQKESQRRREAPHAKTFHGRARIAQGVIVACRQGLQPPQKNFRRHRFPFHGKLQNFVVKIAGKFHRLGVMLFQVVGLVPAVIHVPAFVHHLFAGSGMFQAAFAQHVQHAGHLAVPIFRQRHEHRTHTQNLFDVDKGFVQGIVGIVQLVHEQNRPNARLPEFLESGHRLGLYTAGGTHHKDCPFHRREGRVHLGAKIHVTRRIDKIEPGILPLKVGHATFDSDTPVLFFGQVVHGGKAFFYAARTTHLPCREQNPFRQGGLARIHMGKDGDVPDRLRHGPIFSVAIPKIPHERPGPHKVFPGFLGGHRAPGP